MAYQGLNAHYDCGYFSSFTTGAVYDTTIAYASDALSTYVGPLWMAAQTGPEPASYFQPLNYTEFEEYTADPAHQGYSKNLKIPSDLTAIDPAWSTCTPGMYGSWDPPRALTAARNMVAPTPAQLINDPSSTPAPAAGIDPTHIPATPTPPPQDPTSAPSQADPPTASVDPGSESKPAQLAESNDPPSSAGQTENASAGGNAGDKLAPASMEGQDPDPATKQDIDPPNPPLIQSSPEASYNPPAVGDSSGSSTIEVGASMLNVNQQGSQTTLGTPWGATKSALAVNSVILAPPAPLTIGGSTIEKGPNGGAVIGKSTYTAGYEGKISSVPFSVGPDSIVIGSTTHELPTSTPVLVGGQSMVKAANGGVVIGTSTYPPGIQAQISDTTLSVGVENVVVGSTTYAMPTHVTADTAFIDSQSISRAPDGGAILQGDSTIGLGVQSSINGHVISVGASTVVVDGVSYALPSSVGAVLQAPPAQVDEPVTLTNGAVLIPGGSASTISGTTYAIPSGNSVLVVNGQTVPLPTQTALQSVFTVAGQIFTAAPTGFAVGSQSVTLDGTAVTIDGTEVSLGPSGVQVGSKTMPLTSAQTSEGGLGGLIMSGFGSGGEAGVAAGSGNGSNVLAFTGNGRRVERELFVVFLEIVIMMLGLVVL